jgi:hypothetical protein
MLMGVALDHLLEPAFEELWNDSGYYLSCFSGFIQGSSDILFAELFATYQSFILAKNMVIDE